VTFHKGVGAHPVEEVLPAIPHRKNNVRIAIVDGAQDLVRDEPFHLIHQSGSLSEHLLKSVRVFRLDVKAISNSYHNLAPLPGSMPMLTMLEVVPSLSFFD